MSFKMLQPGKVKTLVSNNKPEWIHTNPFTMNCVFRVKLHLHYHLFAKNKKLYLNHAKHANYVLLNLQNKIFG